MLTAVCKKKIIRNEKETFYRYDIDGTTVWFTEESGDIYRVSIAESEKLTNHVELYVICQEFYPTHVEICVECARLNTPSEINEHIEAIKYAGEMAEAVMSIFNLPEHKNK